MSGWAKSTIPAALTEKVPQDCLSDSVTNYMQHKTNALPDYRINVNSNGL